MFFSLLKKGGDAKIAPFCSKKKENKKRALIWHWDKKRRNSEEVPAARS